MMKKGKISLDEYLANEERWKQKVADLEKQIDNLRHCSECGDEIMNICEDCAKNAGDFG